MAAVAADSVARPRLGARRPRPARMRIATIDIGTNTVLLLVAERQADGSLNALVERATITRLGEGVDRSQRLAPAAVARTCACIEDYSRLVGTLGVDRVAVVGTSAMREATGGQEVRDCVSKALGVEAQVVSGEDEARLAFRGAISGLAIDSGEETAVFDIGGGSTEVVLGRREENGVLSLKYLESFALGSVRLTERLLAHDPPAGSELDALGRTFDKAFSNVPPLPGNRAPVGIAGTMTTLASVSLGMVPYDGARLHGRSLSREELRSTVSRLASLDLSARREVPGMEPKRADVIVAGGCIALALLDHWDAAAVTISDRGVRWGLAEELARGENVHPSPPAGAFTSKRLPKS
jgi:exopolyphosphatase / guanosine-5'-triphosphate,3'-diphosphate pyrophosphatase